MSIRTYQPGDDTALVSIYNEAAAHLPRFKAATLDEVRRRCLAADFDPGTHFFAVQQNQTVGYARYHINGRVSYPWCRQGHEQQAEPLMEAVLQSMRQRGIQRAFAAYRSEWAGQAEFFLQHGFHKAREMINYVLDILEMPTPAGNPSQNVSALAREDIPAVLQLSPEVYHVHSEAELEQHLFHNPRFPPDAVFALRGRSDAKLLAVGVLVVNDSYADPRQVDSGMPCYRLGAFGTEGMQTKRINGLFSFVADPSRNVLAMGLDLLGHCTMILRDTDIATFAAQVPSDVEPLARFYRQYFRRQGSFPVFERQLDPT